MSSYKHIMGRRLDNGGMRWIIQEDLDLFWEEDHLGKTTSKVKLSELDKKMIPRSDGTWTRAWMLFDYGKSGFFIWEHPSGHSGKVYTKVVLKINCKEVEDEC